jgi:hypothetical protein
LLTLCNEKRLPADGFRGKALPLAKNLFQKRLVNVLEGELLHVEEDPVEVHVDLVELAQHGVDATFVMGPAPEDRPIGHAADLEGQKKDPQQGN